MFLEHQISILKWFQKDHVTLKTGVMTTEKKNHNITVFAVFLQINAALVSIGDLK